MKIFIDLKRGGAEDRSNEYLLPEVQVVPGGRQESTSKNGLPEYLERMKAYSRGGAGG